MYIFTIIHSIIDHNTMKYYLVVSDLILQHHPLTTKYYLVVSDLILRHHPLTT